MRDRPITSDGRAEQAMRIASYASVVVAFLLTNAAVYWFEMRTMQALPTCLFLVVNLQKLWQKFLGEDESGSNSAREATQASGSPAGADSKAKQVGKNKKGD